MYSFPHYLAKPFHFLVYVTLNDVKHVKLGHSDGVGLGKAVFMER
jgi:hypothetical protein